MRKEKFTKGPWRSDLVDETLVTTTDGKEVAQICGDYSQSETWPVMEANASLISAAPDLYAALSLFMEYNELMDEGDDVAGMLKYAELMEAAPKALAKARGES